MKYILPWFFSVCLVLSGTPVSAIGSALTRQEKKALKGDQPEVAKMDELSLYAYLSAVAGVASLFFAPAATILFMPAGLVMGIIALVKGRRRNEYRRGKGLAIAAVVLGGAFAALFVISFTIFLFAF